MTTAQDALAGRDVEVDFSSIEKTLAELWRGQGEGEEALTRAALWNVIAHAMNDEDKSRAEEVLAKASSRVPQRTILICAKPEAEPSISAWISANCHVLGRGKQLCSEEISIVAGGDRVGRIPPLVEALLLPNVPVLAWAIGDLPTEPSYTNALLAAVDRLIVDSSEFSRAEHFEMLDSLARTTSTAPADLNWTRIEEWRTATASCFDHAGMRKRLGRIRGVRVKCASPDGRFANVTGSLLYLGWLFRQAGYAVGSDGTVRGDGWTVEWEIERIEVAATGRRRIQSIEIRFDDDRSAVIERRDVDGALRAFLRPAVESGETITHFSEWSLDQLLVRQLGAQDDPLLARVIPVAVALARKVAQ
ncbi:MAG: glucose-6-phosphate dehydrogenase assembly protein OpcA [Thermoanaerobaculia bacterium]